MTYNKKPSRLTIPCVFRDHFAPLPPGKASRIGMGFPLQHISDETTQYRREFEAMPAISGGDYQSRSLRVVINPEVAIPGVTIQAQPAADQPCIGQAGEGIAEKGPAASFIAWGNGTWLGGMNAPARPVIGDLERAVGLRREAVPASASNIGGPRDKVRRLIFSGVVGPEMEAEAGLAVARDGCVAMNAGEGSTVGKPCGTQAVHRTKMDYRSRKQVH